MDKVGEKVACDGCLDWALSIPLGTEFHEYSICTQPIFPGRKLLARNRRLSMMVEYVYPCLVWILRICLLATSYGLLRSRFFKFTWLCADKSLPQQHVPKTHVFSNKQNARQLDERPFFTVDEQTELDPGSQWVPHLSSKFDWQYSRDSLLTSRSTVEEPKPEALRRISEENQPCALGFVSESFRSSRQCEYLQSLLQFRALKSSALVHADWTAWNNEAHMILNGAILFDSRQTFIEVYDTMISSGVLPDCETFSLLIECSASLNDARRTKELVTHMTNAGFTPPKQFIDDSDSKHSMGGSDCNLNKDAPEFVPQFRMA